MFVLTITSLNLTIYKEQECYDQLAIKLYYPETSSQTHWPRGLFETLSNI